MPKEKIEEKKEEEETLIKIVPNDFPIEDYLNGEGKLVLCLKERDAIAKKFAMELDTNKKATTIEKAL